MNSSNPVHTTHEEPDNHPDNGADNHPDNGADMDAVRPGNGASTPTPGRAANPDNTADNPANGRADTGDMSPSVSRDVSPSVSGHGRADSTTAAPSGVDAVAGFWQARPELATIRQYAQASVAAPWAVLGCVLARVALSTPPALVLPALGNGTMGVGSLNVFIGLVGPSGSGKGLAAATARGVLDVAPGAGRPITSLPLGSGEGISHAFHTTDDDGNPVPAPWSVWFDVAEIDTLTALTGRQGSTTAAEVRKVFSGEGLGFQNADAQRRKIVDAHAYRAALVAGVQPRKAGPLLADDAGGTPQRFLWVPVMDRTAPDEAPPAPSPLNWSSPVLATQAERVVMDLHPAIRAELEANQRARLRGETVGDNGQQSLVRLKVAALLALLNQRLNVTQADWQLADYIMSVSDQTRQWMRDAVADDAARAIQARAADRAAYDDHHDQAAIARTADRLLGKIPTTPTSVSSIKKTLGSAQRDHYEAALILLSSRGQIDRWEDEYRGQNRTVIRRRE